MATESAFVGDGYDLTGSVPRVAGVHPAVDITYRPCTVDERNRYLKTATEPEKRAAAGADLIVRHVSGWSLGGKPTRDLALKLQPLLFDRVVDFLTGYAGSAEEAADVKNS